MQSSVLSAEQDKMQFVQIVALNAARLSSALIAVKSFKESVMKLNKNFKYYALIWFLGLIVFNIITFVTPNEIMGIRRFEQIGFWIGYAFTMFAFILQLICSFVFLKQDSKEKLFLHFSLYYIGYGILILSLIVGAVFMLVPVIPAWVGSIVCVLLIFFYVLAAVKAVVAANKVSEIDEKVKVQTMFIRSAIVDAESIKERAKSAEIKNNVNKVYEALKYSDTVSTEALSTIESEIATQLDQLKNDVESEDVAKVGTTCNKLLILISDRNNKCKLLK
jgi:hypothetical protein